MFEHRLVPQQRAPLGQQLPAGGTVLGANDKIELAGTEGVPQLTEDAATVAAELARRVVHWGGTTPMGCVINRYAFPVRLVDHRHVVAEYTEMVRLRGGRAGLVVHEPRAPPATTVLYAHGNAETVFQLGRLLAYYASVFGVRIVAFDWPGYGATPGAPSERALCRSAEAAY